MRVAVRCLVALCHHGQLDETSQVAALQWVSVLPCEKWLGGTQSAELHRVLLLVLSQSLHHAQIKITGPKVVPRGPLVVLVSLALPDLQHHLLRLSEGCDPGSSAARLQVGPSDCPLSAS